MNRMFSILALLSLVTGAPAVANVIDNCVQGTFTAGTVNSCVFTQNTATFTGSVNISETFTSDAPNLIGIGLFLTNTIAGNNIPGIFDYTISKVILNETGTNWYGFTVTDGVGAASALGPVTLINGFTSCTSASGSTSMGGLGFQCSGGIVPNGGTFILQYHQSTPLDQRSGAMEIFESAMTPEPATLILTGIVLIVAGSCFAPNIALKTRGKSLRH